MKHVRSVCILLSLVCSATCTAQSPTPVEFWTTETLNSIRRDLARPPIHARNLFHLNAALYDCWAVYGEAARPWLIGGQQGGFASPFAGVPVPPDVQAARTEAMAHAAYRLLRHRFINSPGATVTYARLDAVMDSLGYDRSFTGEDYWNGAPAALGNHVAAQYIAYGMQDGANEVGNYANQVYQPVNLALPVEEPGNPLMTDPDRWQPLSLPVAIDQAGNVIPGIPAFVGAEWGEVKPFALDTTHMETFFRDGLPWKVYLDQGPPAYMEGGNPPGEENFFTWNHTLVSLWQAHLDPMDTLRWDISPGAIGNIPWLPESPEEYLQFYDRMEGGDPGTGHPLNPVTGEPYAAQRVKRADYARVLAEYWADGLDSETPPGHWFEILHDVMRLPGFQRRWRGQGPELDPLEFDAKVHFALGAAMHDAAIAAWSIKGYYDTSRPVSVIRYMARMGQSSDPALPNYHPEGLPLIPGRVELVMPGDPLEGDAQQHLHKVKLWTYRGPRTISDPTTEVAGVGWILAENFWPYQRPTFVSPPFAGYVSGHSTYSRTAAEMLTAITGSPFLPGGMIEYVIPQNDFLVFEVGPSEEIRLQWATYQDASDACSLSRIWGGIHPPIDDIPGRRIGMQLAPLVMERLDELFLADPPRVVEVEAVPEVVNRTVIGQPFTLTLRFDRPMDPNSPPQIFLPADDPFSAAVFNDGELFWADPSRLQFAATVTNEAMEFGDIRVGLASLTDQDGVPMQPRMFVHPFVVDTRSPLVDTAIAAQPVLGRAHIGTAACTVELRWDEAMDTTDVPSVMAEADGLPVPALVLNSALGAWTDARTYRAVFDLLDVPATWQDIDLRVEGPRDVAGNPMDVHTVEDLLLVDLVTPELVAIQPSAALLALANVGGAAWSVELTYSKAMDPEALPAVTFLGGDPLAGTLVPNLALSGWQSNTVYHAVYDVSNSGQQFPVLDLQVASARDAVGNEQVPAQLGQGLRIDLQRPLVAALLPDAAVLALAAVADEALRLEVSFAEAMDTDVAPLVVPTSGQGLSGTLVYRPSLSQWVAEDRFAAVFALTPLPAEVEEVSFRVAFARDAAGNSMEEVNVFPDVWVDTRPPELLGLSCTPNALTDADLGPGAMVMDALFSEAMEPTAWPAIGFGPGEWAGVLVEEAVALPWVDEATYRARFGLYAAPVWEPALEVLVSGARDRAGNPMLPRAVADALSVTLSGVGIAEPLRQGDLQVWPVPVARGGTMQVRCTTCRQGDGVQWVDLLGHEVWQGALGSGFATGHSLDVPSLSAGMYLLIVQGSEGAVMARVMVE